MYNPNTKIDTKGRKQSDVIRSDRSRKLELVYVDFGAGKTDLHESPT